MNDDPTTPPIAYRYVLTRPGTSPLGWVMLNPSTADEQADDPTIRKCLGFTARAGYDGLLVANLFPLRATDPADLWRASPADRLGDPDAADAAIRYVCDRSCAVVLAWGGHGARYPERVRHVIDIIRAGPVRAMYLTRTKDGQPRHPLMLSYSTPMMPWPPR